MRGVRERNWVLGGKPSKGVLGCMNGVPFYDGRRGWHRLVLWGGDQVRVRVGCGMGRSLIRLFEGCAVGSRPRNVNAAWTTDAGSERDVLEGGGQVTVGEGCVAEKRPGTVV